MLTWLERMCLRSCNRRIAFWATVILASLITVIANHRYAEDFFRGPFSTSAETLEAISNAEEAEHSFVRVTGSKTLDTGIQEITSTTRNGVKVQGSERVSAGYYAVLVGKHFLVVKSPITPAGSVEGEIKPMPVSLRTNLESFLHGKHSREYFYPVVLETEGFRYPGYWAIGFGVVLLFCVFRYMRPAWILKKDISKHPVIVRIKTWGEIVSLSAEVEREYGQDVLHKSHGRRITQRFVIDKTFFNFNVFRFVDLLWAYKHVTRHSVNFIPTGKTYKAVMIFYGGSAEIPGSEAKVNGILQTAAEKAPWAVFGFSEDLKQLFRKNTEEFCVGIETRRRELQSKA
jgi:hypothetical protein